MQAGTKRINKSTKRCRIDRETKRLFKRALRSGRAISWSVARQRVIGE